MDILSKNHRSLIMSKIKSQNSIIEKSISKSLFNLGLRYRKNVPSLPGKPDISIKKYKIVIFIDSCFWHNCKYHARLPKSNINYWTEKLNRNRFRDKEINKYYKILGWNVLRIWEHEYKKNPSATIEKISSFIISVKNLYL